MDPPDLARLLCPARLREIHAHALETHPRECCGAVRGSGVIRFTNVQDALHAEDPVAFPRTARTAFRPSDAEQLLLARSAERRDGTGDPIRILYHSHHDAAVGAALSPEDIRGLTHDGHPLYPELLLLVVDVRTADDGTPHVHDTRLHRLTGSAYVDVPLPPAVA